MRIPLDEVVHIVQVALTPVFLLSGIASSLLNQRSVPTLPEDPV